jgi:hypothetical protein
VLISRKVGSSIPAITNFGSFGNLLYPLPMYSTASQVIPERRGFQQIGFLYPCSVALCVLCGKKLFSALFERRKPIFLGLGKIQPSYFSLVFAQNKARNRSLSFFPIEKRRRRKQYGSRRNSRDPCCSRTTYGFAPSRNGSYENAFIARIRRVRNSASGCKLSRTDWNAGVYVRNLPSTCLCLRPLGLRELSGFRPHGAR